MGAATEIRVPDIGDFAEVDVIEVLVKSGDRVNPEDPLVTLESDKATMDVPSPSGGIVLEVLVASGDKVREGTPILMLDGQASAEEAPPAGNSEPEPAPAGVVAAPEAEERGEVAPAARTEDRSDDEPQHPAPPPTLPPPAEKAGMAKPHASPSVRRFARELGVDLTSVRGSGAKGRILRDDVQAFVKRQLSRPSSAGAPGELGLPVLPEVDFTKFGEIEYQPLNKIKRLTAASMHRSWLNVPHVTQHDEADITDLEDFRQSLKAEAAQSGVRVTLLAFILKASARTLRAFPEVNASLERGGENLILKKYVHIGVAVDTPEGLVVPVIRDVDRKDINALAAELGELSEKARNRKLGPADLQGASFTISSLGGISGTAFTPIVNAPEVAILGVSRSKLQPQWTGSEFVPRLMLPLSFSYDHRVIDGAQAARFTGHLCQLLADLRRVLL
jgi:pyruvate dehydrogenase E2 component (dihydrolipoamide acetyltransferase)